MRPLVLVLLAAIMTFLVAGAFGLLRLGYLAEEVLPAALGLLALVWMRMYGGPTAPSSPPLKALLWQNVIYKMDDRPQIRVEIRKASVSHSRTG